MQAVVDGLLTNYSIEGEGDNVLIIHGWGSTSESLKSIVGDLSKAFRTIALDLPGMGLTENPSEPWALDDFSNFISDFLTKVKVKDLKAIIGHSNGGAIAIKMINRQKLPIQKLILLSSSGVRDTDKARKSLTKVVAKVGKNAIKALPDSIQKKTKQRFYNAIGSEGLILPEMEQTFRNVVDEDVQDLARSIKQPTLLIYGDQDESTPPSYGQKLANNIKNSRFETIKGAGHFPQLDAPQEVLTLINTFLK